MPSTIMAIAAHPGDGMFTMGAAVAQQIHEGGKGVKACALFPMWRGENGFRYNDYYQSLAVMRGALANCRYAVALMSDPEQRNRTVTSLDLSS